jgi:hypothetical protein
VVLGITPGRAGLQRLDGQSRANLNELDVLAIWVLENAEFRPGYRLDVGGDHGLGVEFQTSLCETGVHFFEIIDTKCHVRVSDVVLPHIERAARGREFDELDDKIANRHQRHPLCVLGEIQGGCLLRSRRDLKGHAGVQTEGVSVEGEGPL